VAANFPPLVSYRHKRRRLTRVPGPNGAFTNLPPLIDIQVDFIADAIQRAGKKGVFEATQSAQDEWTELCEQLCGASLFKKTHSWIFGTNIPGKKKSVIFFFGGMTKYREKLAQVVKDGYAGFRINGREGVKEVSA
jgi:cyclohexanone monooxygenase